MLLSAVIVYQDIKLTLTKPAATSASEERILLTEETAFLALRATSVPLVLLRALLALPALPQMLMPLSVWHVVLVNSPTVRNAYPVTAVSVLLVLLLACLAKLVMAPSLIILVAKFAKPVLSLVTE